MFGHNLYGENLVSGDFNIGKSGFRDFPIQQISRASFWCSITSRLPFWSRRKSTDGGDPLRTFQNIHDHVHSEPTVRN